MSEIETVKVQVVGDPWVKEILVGVKDKRGAPEPLKPAPKPKTDKEARE